MTNTELKDWAIEILECERDGDFHTFYRKLTDEHYVVGDQGLVELGEALRDCDSDLIDLEEIIFSWMEFASGLSVCPPPYGERS